MYSIGTKLFIYGLLCVNMPPLLQDVISCDYHTLVVPCSIPYIEYFDKISTLPAATY